MMTVGKHRIKNHMTFEYDFTGIRILGSSLIPVDWHLSVNLVAVDKKSKAREDVEYHATIAYQKLLFWLDTNLPNVVVVDVNSEDDLYIANLSSNIMLYCPSSPYDDMIIQLLHSKMSMLCEGFLIVGEMKLKGSDMLVQHTYDCINNEYNLPLKTADYYTESKVRDDIPWWFRNDGFCFELVRSEDATVSDEEFYKDVVDPLTEFDKIVKEETDKHIGIVREPARIVQVERWRPKKV
jgi:hypothetical protein